MASIKFTTEGRYNLMNTGDMTTGVKLNILGYALCKNSIDDIENLSIDNVDVENLILQPNTEDMRLRDRLFNLTYIPALETTIVDTHGEDIDNNTVNNLGHYEIILDSKTENFACIILFGECINEKQESFNYTETRDLYVVGIIEQTQVEQPTKIVFKVSITDDKPEEVNKKLRIVDQHFNTFTEHEFMKDLNTIQIPDNVILANTPFFTLDIQNEKSTYNNLVIYDKVKNLNQPWNVTAKAFIGKDNNSPIPQLHIGNYSTEDYTTNGVNIDYTNNYFSIGRDIGNDNFIADIFNKGEETTIIKNFVTINSMPGGGEGDDVSILNLNLYNNSKPDLVSNFLHNCSSITFNKSLNNFLTGVSGICFLNSDRNIINFQTGFKYNTFIGSYSSVCFGDSNDTNALIENNVFLGTDNVLFYPSIVYKNPIITRNTLIGQNYESKFTFYNIEQVHPKDEDNFKYLEDNAIIGFSGLTIPQSIESIKIEQHDITATGGETSGFTAYIPSSYNHRLHSTIIGNYNSDLQYFNAFSAENMREEVYVSAGSYEGQVTSWSAEENKKLKYNPLSLGQHLYFRHSQDQGFGCYAYNSYGSNTYNEGYLTACVSADEGDFCLNRLFVVGNGEKYDYTSTGYSPAQYASINYNLLSQQCKRINLFSVENNSYQLVHDTNTILSGITEVECINSMFAVRGIEPSIQKYFFRNLKGGVGYTDCDSDISVKLKNVDRYIKIPTNKYLLQNAIYSVSSLYVPLYRSSNDVYKVTFEDITAHINERKGVSENFTKLKNNTDGTNKFDSAYVNKYTKNLIFTYVIPKYKSKISISDVTGSYKMHYDFGNKPYPFQNDTYYTFYIINKTDNTVTLTDNNYAIWGHKCLMVTWNKNWTRNNGIVS